MRCASSARKLARKPSRGGRVVGIVEDADDFNEESANCLPQDAGRTARRRDSPAHRHRDRPAVADDPVALSGGAVRAL